MKWSFPIARIFGTQLRIHITFFLLLIWVGFAFAGEGDWTDGLTGVVFVLALFVCVILHEFGHALTARVYGIKTPDITLLPIGGVARLERMPKEPTHELLVALAGPAVNLVIAAILFVILQAGTPFREAYMKLDSLSGFFGSLMLINIWLVLFNLIPAFPMDGGRVLRALLATRLPYAKATNVAAWFWDRGQAKAVWLPPLGGTTVPNRGAFGVSANGSQVVGWAQASLTQQAAVMWTHGGAPVVLHKTGDTVLGLSALSISPDGSVVAGFAYNAGTGKNTAFKWTESGGMVALSPPTTGTHALTYTTAVRVSANGRVIVGYGENVLGNEEAVFWVDEQPFRVSDIAFAAGALPASWEPFRAYGVDATGNSISGYGRATSGKIEAYVLVLDASYIPPQPPPPPLPIIKSAFIEGSLSIRFVGVPGIDYRIRGGKNLKTWNTLDDWKEGTGQEVLFATIPDLSDSGYFIQVEARAD
ncbi:MAG: site-2 protease family protein [Verrucomicrobia bacterium]|nr:site-2 protease family protein [Verrucomicrobiota bacterium]MDA1067377.1 site-2 protease family protein [Verrucomicrobiota bacterium]